MMSQRDKQKKKARKTGNEEDWKRYQKMRNKVTFMMRNAKKAYVKGKIQENAGNSAGTWKALRCIIPSKQSNTSIHSVKHNEQSHS